MVVLWIDGLEDLAVKIYGFVPPVHGPQSAIEGFCFVPSRKTSLPANVDPRHF